MWNDSVVDVKVPKYLDKLWYIERAKEKLADFLGGSEEVDEKYNINKNTLYARLSRGCDIREVIEYKR